jgi:FMN phosphatase YigB (HAD superfamily)
VSTTIAAVSFDLDGTLYDLKKAKGPLLWATFPRWRTLRVGRRVRDEMRHKQYPDGAAFLAAEAAIAGERLDVDAARARAQIDAVFNVDLVRVLARVGPRAEARAILDAIVTAGLPIAVISDRGAVDEKLQALGLHDLPWRARVAADDVGAMKPDARVFRVAADAMGIDPTAMLHVGDRDDSDGEGARGVGAQFFLVADSSPTPLVGLRSILGLNTSEQT